MQGLAPVCPYITVPPALDVGCNFIPDQMIRRLGFVSRPIAGLSRLEIPRIVAISRARNATDDIRGVQAFTGLDFAQVIEGPEGAVANLWLRIRADDRHCDIVTLVDERAQACWFEDWRVAFPSDGPTVGRIASWRTSVADMGRRLACRVAGRFLVARRGLTSAEKNARVRGHSVFTQFSLKFQGAESLPRVLQC